MIKTARTEAELSSLRRSFQQAFTSIELCRRKWAALSEKGKRLLEDCTNACLRLAYAEAPTETHWGALGMWEEVRRGVANRALQQQRVSQEAVRSLLQASSAPGPGLCGDRVGSDRSLDCASGLRQELEALVARMNESVTALHRRLQESIEAIGSELACGERLFNTESSAALLSRLDEITAAYSTEVELRRGVVNTLASGRPSRDLSSWDSGVKLQLSAWVLQPHLDEGSLDLFFEAHAAEGGPMSPPGRSPGRSPGSGQRRR
jgi:hypothetical protein